MRGWPNPTRLIKMIRLACVRVCAHAWTTGMWGSGGLPWGQEFYGELGQGHLSSTKRSSQGVEVWGRGRGGRRLQGQISIILAVFYSHCQLCGNWPLSGRPLQPHFGCSLSQSPPFTGPPETFVPFISTTNTYRCSGKEEAKRQRLSKHMLPPVNDCWFGDNLLLCKQTTCWRAQSRSGFIIQHKHGQLSV